MRKIRSRDIKATFPAAESFDRQASPHSTPRCHEAVWRSPRQEAGRREGSVVILFVCPTIIPNINFKRKTVLSISTILW